MLRTGLSILVLLMISGCAGIIGGGSEQADQSKKISLEQSRNTQLRTEAAALREAVQQYRNELNQLQPESSN